MPCWRPLRCSWPSATPASTSMPADGRGCACGTTRGCRRWCSQPRPPVRTWPLPLCPLPSRRRWLAPLALGALAAALLVVGRVTRVPSALAFGSAALVMTSAALIPVEPCDGAYVGSRRASLVATAALLGVSILLVLHVL